MREWRPRVFTECLSLREKKGKNFIVDCELDVETTACEVSDQIDDAVDYSLVAKLISSQIQAEPVNLIEVLASRMADSILEQFPTVRAVEITVHKPEAPIPVPFKDVSTTVVRKSEKR